MAVRVVRLGSLRRDGEGTRLGTVRRPPRGVAKKDFAKLDYYDAWLPELAPSAELLEFAHAGDMAGKHFAAFARRYRAEMNAPERQRLIAVLARMSHDADFSVGCYCAEEARCHRSILRELLEKHGAVVAEAPEPGPVADP